MQQEELVNLIQKYERHYNELMIKSENSSKRMLSVYLFESVIYYNIIEDLKKLLHE